MICRIVGKCIGWVVKKDMQEAAGPLQMAVVPQSGVQAAINFLKEVFDDEQTDYIGSHVS